MPPEILAAGGAVYRLTESGPLFALVHRPRYTDWTLPKGKADEGEPAPDAAAREVAEETGFAPSLGPELGAVAYRVGDREKIVHYWLVEAGAGRFSPNDEVDELRWLDAVDAMRLVTYRRDRNVLAWAARRLAGPDRGRLYLVRHAYAGVRAEWDGPDAVRPVCGPGHAEVAAATELLSELPVTRVMTSPFVRCVQSVAPLAQALGMEPEPEPRLADRAPVHPTFQLVGELAGQAAVLCTHGDNIADLIGAAAAAGAELDAGLVWEKGSTWLLETRGRTILSGRYYRPGRRES